MRRWLRAAAFLVLLGFAAPVPAAEEPDSPFYRGLQDEPSPELVALVPQGLEIFDFANGDLNGDGRADAVLVLREPNEAEGSDVPRPLLLLVRHADGKLRVERRTDRLVYCHDCGGMMGDPYQGVAIEDGRFTVRHYGGSAWRWSNAYTFGYDASEQDWFLEKEQSDSFHASDPQGSDSETIITRDELGDIAISDFDFDRRDQEYRETRWRVVAERARFYDQPSLSSTPRAAYVIRGDVVEGYYQLRNFVHVGFTNEEGEVTSGFLLKRDLELLPVPSER